MIAASTSWKIFCDVTEAIATVLRKKYVRFPQNDAELIEIMRKFEATTGLPQCAGMLDCTHIKITKQDVEFPDSFENYKHFFSIVAQIISGPSGEVLQMRVGDAGRNNDVTIWHASEIGEVCYMLAHSADM